MDDGGHLGFGRDHPSGTETHTRGTHRPPHRAPSGDCQQALCSEVTSSAGRWPDGIHPGCTFLNHPLKSTDAEHSWVMGLSFLFSPPPHVEHIGPFE